VHAVVILSKSNANAFSGSNSITFDSLLNRS
jgi:hypothetical protein